jgi:hypothetical protein
MNKTYEGKLSKKVWTQRRNRAKGQISFMLGTGLSIQGDLKPVLSESEQTQLLAIRKVLLRMLEDWTEETEEAKKEHGDLE